MPIKIPAGLPAVQALENENIFVMDEKRALSQDIRPLNIVILNLMPTKVETELHLLRLLGNNPLQIEIILLHPKTHISKNTSQEHLSKFYHTFDEIKHRKFDGMIITGAPVEHLEFESVNYWEELKSIMEWSRRNVYSTFHICWGAQAGLYYHYGIPKYPQKDKIFGVFLHKKNKKRKPLLRGFDDFFYAPHSRYTFIKKEDVENNPELEVLSESEEAGVYLVSRKDGRQVFVTGHSEYDAYTLESEYERDIKKGLSINPPKNYYPNNNPEKEPVVMWKSHAYILFSNWVNYYVYQETPYKLEEITELKL